MGGSWASVNIDIFRKSELPVQAGTHFWLSGFPELLESKFSFGNLTLPGGFSASVRETGIYGRDVPEGQTRP